MGHRCTEMDILASILTIVGTSGLTAVLVYMVICYAINKFQGGLLEFFNQGIVKRGMSMIGKQSGEARRNKAVENQIANSVIQKTIGPYKIIIDKVLGIDIDGMVEEYGAMEVLNTLQRFLPMLKQAGVDLDIGKMIQGALGGEGQNSNTGSGNIGLG